MDQHTGATCIYNCTKGGVWKAVDCECRLISTTDAFSYLNEEMWQTEDDSQWNFLDDDNGGYYMYDESSQDTLTSFAQFNVEWAVGSH